MKKLGNITLPIGMVWSDKYHWPPVGQSVERTLDGGQVVFVAALDKVRNITLITADTAWLSQETVEAIYDAASQAGAVFILEWDNESIQVMFRHQEPPAFEVTPIWTFADKFTCNIKLMSV